MQIIPLRKDEPVLPISELEPGGCKIAAVQKFKSAYSLFQKFWRILEFWRICARSCGNTQTWDEWLHDNYFARRDHSSVTNEYVQGCRERFLYEPAIKKA